MEKKKFNELLESIKQGGKILKGKRKTSQEEKELLKSYDNGELKSIRRWEMNKETSVKLFEKKLVRSHWNEEKKMVFLYC
jgi:hypothetical protein